MELTDLNVSLYFKIVALGLFSFAYLKLNKKVINNLETLNHIAKKKKVDVEPEAIQVKYMFRKWAMINKKSTSRHCDIAIIGICKSLQEMNAHLKNDSEYT